MKTNAIFKCIVTLSNGTHKIIRMAIDEVAKFCAAVRELRNSPWLIQRYTDFFRKIELNPNDFACCKFVNEYTGETLIEL